MPLATGALSHWGVSLRVKKWMSVQQVLLLVNWALLPGSSASRNLKPLYCVGPASGSQGPHRVTGPAGRSSLASGNRNCPGDWAEPPQRLPSVCPSSCRKGTQPVGSCSPRPGRGGLLCPQRPGEITSFYHCPEHSVTQEDPCRSAPRAAVMQAVVGEVCAHPSLNPFGWFFSVLLILAALETHLIKEMLLTDSVTLSKVEGLHPLREAAVNWRDTVLMAGCPGSWVGCHLPPL